MKAVFLQILKNGFNGPPKPLFFSMKRCRKFAVKYRKLKNILH